MSAAAHVGLLVVLSCIPYITPFDPDPLVLTSIADLDDEQYKFENVTAVDVIGNDSDMNTLGPSREAAQRASENNRDVQEEKIEDTLDLAQAPPEMQMVAEPEARYTDIIESNGSPTEHPGGVEGAIDRLTFEIADSLRSEGKTIVLWLFDASLSLEGRRNAIADRFENVYKQLSHMNVVDDKALKTVVASFGKQTKILTPEPIEDAATAANLIRKIESDTSGRENVFTAISDVTNRFMTYRTSQRRNMMVVIVTDERGDDMARMEDTIHKLARYGIRCYVVGNAAVFGREKGYVKWTYKDGTFDYIGVDQGPETYYPDRLQLKFWGPNGRDLDKMSASYGPYALTRLCAETRGLYLVAEENSGPRFDPATMRDYRPDYRPRKKQDIDIKKSTAKMHLIRAAQLTNRKAIPAPQLEFRADTDNIMKARVTEAQKPLAEFEYALSAMSKELLAGEKSRGDLVEPRWRAAFDLAVGRALAMQVRAKGYNSMLARMKSNPRSFETKGSNTWRLTPSEEMTSGPAIRKVAKKALTYLKRVVDDHPGTPWATLAERELSQPMGWEWKELSRDYAAIERRRAEQNTVLVVDPETGKKKRVPRSKRKKPVL